MFIPSRLPDLVSCCQSVVNSLETLERIDTMDIFPPSLVLYTRRLGIRVPLGALEKPLFHGVFRIYDLYMAARREFDQKRLEAVANLLSFSMWYSFRRSGQFFGKHIYTPLATGYTILSP
jgi:hypothetical protein